MNEQERHDRFSELITSHQSQLYGYIFALVRNWEDAADLFQAVCVVLWRKFDSFDPSTNSFFPWARQTAVFEVRNFLRNKKCRRHVAEQMLSAFTETPFDRQSDSTPLYLEALRRCKHKLTTPDAELLDLHYSKDLSAQEIADQVGRTRQSVCNSLARVRRWLFDCVRIQMAQQGHGREEHR